MWHLCGHSWKSESGRDHRAVSYASEYTLTSDTMLYFGCRSLKSDQYYAEEWEKYRALGASVRVAASRDGTEKVYVQDLIREDRVRLHDWIINKEAHVYICG